MNEPADRTAVVDNGGGTWVRTDDMPGRYGNWWPMTDGPGFDVRAHDGIGTSRVWADVEEYGPFTPAGPERTARAIERVRREVSR